MSITAITRQAQGMRRRSHRQAHRRRLLHAS
jgi:hypothetical protein